VQLGRIYDTATSSPPTGVAEELMRIVKIARIESFVRTEPKD